MTRPRNLLCLDSSAFQGPAIAHGIGHEVGSVEEGKLADLVLWDPRFFGIRPEVVIKGGRDRAGSAGRPERVHPDPAAGPDAAGARLVWHGAPFVVAESAGVRRSTTLDLGPGATCLLRETLVLGRQGEAPGRLVVDTKIALEGLPVLVERFELGPEALVPGVLGQARVVDQITDLGPCSAEAMTGMLVESYGVLHRKLGTQAHDASLDEVWNSLV